MSEQIEWAEVPPSGTGGPGQGSARGFVAALRARPGEWAIYRRTKNYGQSSNTAGYLKKRYGLEAVSRHVDGDYVVYARWPVNGNGSEK